MDTPSHVLSNNVVADFMSAAARDIQTMFAIIADDIVHNYVSVPMHEDACAPILCNDVACDSHSVGVFLNHKPRSARTCNGKSLRRSAKSHAIHLNQHCPLHAVASVEHGRGGAAARFDCQSFGHVEHAIATKPHFCGFFPWISKVSIAIQIPIPSWTDYNGVSLASIGNCPTDRSAWTFNSPTSGVVFSLDSGMQNTRLRGKRRQGKQETEETKGKTSSVSSRGHKGSPFYVEKRAKRIELLISLEQELSHHDL
jgi:hypothetical protein